jgi:hypothetical protein
MEWEKITYVLGEGGRAANNPHPGPPHKGEGKVRKAGGGVRVRKVFLVLFLQKKNILS